MQDHPARIVQDQRLVGSGGLLESQAGREKQKYKEKGKRKKEKGEIP